MEYDAKLIKRELRIADLERALAMERDAHLEAQGMLLIVRAWLRGDIPQATPALMIYEISRALGEDDTGKDSIEWHGEISRALGEDE